MVTTRISGRHKIDPEYVMTTSLEDIARIETFDLTLRGQGRLHIEQLEQRTNERDKKYLFFYFGEDIGLISKDHFRIAAIDMITKIEDTLRVYLLTKAQDEEFGEILEHCTLTKLIKEAQTKVPKDMIESLERINQLRSILIHSNMVNGGKMITDERLMEGSEEWVGGGTAQKHSMTRTFSGWLSDRYAIEILERGLKIVQTLFPDEIDKINAQTFDNMIQTLLDPSKEMKIYG